jgi:O-antigen/teichoic acid export membrane protein
VLNFKIAQAYKHVLPLVGGNSNAAAVFQTVGGRAMMLGVNFGTGVVVARSLGPFGRGEMAAIGLWSTFLAALVTLGIPTALAYQTRRRPEHGPENFAVSVFMMLVMGGVAAAVGIFIIPLLLRGYDHSAVRAAQAFMLFAPTILLSHVVSAHLEAVGAFRRSILAQFNPSIVTLLALVILHLWAHFSPMLAALAYAVPSSLQALWLVARLWPRGLHSLSGLVGRARDLLRYGLRSYGTDIVGTLASQLDLAVIVMFLSAAQLGLYSIALTLSRLLNIVQASLVSVIFPRASSLDPEEGIALITRAARVSTMMSIGLGALFLLIVPILLPRLYGGDFRAAIALLPLLTVEAIIGGLGNVLKQSFLASGRPFVVTVIEAGSIVCAVSFLFVLVPRMNILGAATALLCTSVLRVAAIMAAYRFVLERPIPRLLADAADLAYIGDKIVAKSEPRRAVRLAKGS